jgi:hypothetical protein
MAQDLAPIVDERESSYRAAAPKLSPRVLTGLLVTVTLIPPVMIGVLWAILPPVKANQLKAEVRLENAPPASFYDLRFADRVFDPNVQVIVKNIGDEPWTNINVRVNRYYNIYDHGHPILPGEQQAYLLSRFLHRDVFFDMRYNPVHSVMVYARLPDGSRATYVVKLAE